MSTAIYCDHNSDRIPYVIEETKDLIIPDINISITGLMTGKIKDENWEKAFAWYNRHFVFGKTKVWMGCRPCYVKVMNKLIEYKKKYNSIPEKYKR